MRLRGGGGGAGGAGQRARQRAGVPAIPVWTVPCPGAAALACQGRAKGTPARGPISTASAPSAAHPAQRAQRSMHSTAPTLAAPSARCPAHTQRRARCRCWHPAPPSAVAERQGAEGGRAAGRAWGRGGSKAGACGQAGGCGRAGAPPARQLPSLKQLLQPSKARQSQHPAKRAPPRHQQQTRCGARRARGLPPPRRAAGPGGQTRRPGRAWTPALAARGHGGGRAEGQEGACCTCCAPALCSREQPQARASSQPPAPSPATLTATPQRWLLPGRGGRAPTMAWPRGMSATRAADTAGVARAWKPSGSEGDSEPPRRARLVCARGGAAGEGRRAGLG